MLRRAARFAPRCTSRYLRTKVDIFGYKVDDNTKPFNEKIDKVNDYYDVAGDIVVDMNQQNCPADPETYTALLKAIRRCTAKNETVPGDKITTMMDVMEEMGRSGIPISPEHWEEVVLQMIAENDGNCAKGLVACLQDDGVNVSSSVVQSAEGLRLQPPDCGAAPSTVFEVHIQTN
mgnify:CR=1 FL=1